MSMNELSAIVVLIGLCAGIAASEANATATEEITIEKKQKKIETATFALG